jgi:molybdopterin-guanine dinucleotide biosynthesis protein A
MQLDSRPTNLVVAVPAGGAARRMGTDKALLRLPNGHPAWVAVVTTAREIATRVLLLVDTEEHAARLLHGATPPFPEIVLDTVPGSGPLGALAGAFHAAPQSALLLLAADMPLVRAAVLKALYTAHRDLEDRAPLGRITAPVIGGITQPMPACYDTNLVAEADRLLLEGRRDLHALLESPRVVVRRLLEEDLTAIDPDLRSFAGANTPGEWEALLGRAKP